jgi:hypothetical protein
MKDDLMKRSMFAPKGSKPDMMNSGIMAALRDGAGMEDMPDMEESSVDELPPMSRTPQNPEILMNNLRGDMRSVDARYQELANMVGDQAAQETPPEVLALLQEHLAMMQQPQGGIGGLPQAPQMPPGMPQPPTPPMPPAGMEGMPPFPQGGAEQAPPTPDGLPPERAALGKFISSAARYGNEAADVFRSGLQATDRYLGDLLSSPYLGASPMRDAQGRRLVGQGRESLTEGSNGLSMGQGTRLQGLNTMDLRSPTFSRALEESLRTAPGSTAVTAAIGAAPIANEMGKSIYDRITSGPQAPFESQADQIPGQGPPTRDPTGRPLYENFPPFEANFVDRGDGMPSVPVSETPPPANTDIIGFTPAPTQQDQMAADIKRMSDTLEEKRVGKTKMDRVKETQKEYAPLFQELMGDTKEEMRTNALLLLADAGFKFASTYKPTMAMALSESLSGMPKGLAALAAQARDRGIKVKTAVLQQALSDVTMQDKMAQDLQIKLIEVKNKRDIENLRNDREIWKTIYTEGGLITEQLPMGHRLEKTKKGDFKRQYVDPNDPTVQSAIRSDWTLNDSNPFVTMRGPAKTTVQQTTKELEKMSEKMVFFDDALANVEAAKRVVMNAYQPSSWFSSVKNNLFVPIVPGMSPNVAAADIATQLKTIYNGLSKNAAALNDGRVSVQQQEWERDNLKALDNPEAFFKDPQLAAKQLMTLEAMYRTQRQRVLEQAGYVDQSYEMRTPNTGTKDDPFVLPDPQKDPTGYKNMSSFLAGTIGTADNPNALVYVRSPSGEVLSFSPIKLRGLIQ